ncbi:MAG: DNA-3-methyladenine glycosylase [Leptospirales bacterium]
MSNDISRIKSQGLSVTMDPSVFEPASLNLLSRSFYDRKADLVARELLGKYLVHRDAGEERIGRIVETEAYLGPHDLASHSSRGLTPRTSVMFGPPGHAYIYLVYGIHCCMNVVTESAGHASAVLLRALEPVRNIEGRTQGPGLLSRAMGLDRRLNGHDLLSPDFFIAERPGDPVAPIARRPRIGVDYAGPWAKKLLRFYAKGSPFVSKA